MEKCPRGRCKSGWEQVRKVSHKWEEECGEKLRTAALGGQR
jgi:hypothetical protein